MMIQIIVLRSLFDVVGQKLTTSMQVAVTEKSAGRPTRDSLFTRPS